MLETDAKSKLTLV